MERDLKTALQFVTERMTMLLKRRYSIIRMGCENAKEEYWGRKRTVWTISIKLIRRTK